MNCRIIPEIKEIQLKDDIIDMKDFYIDDCYKQTIPSAFEIYDEVIKQSSKKYPIIYYKKNALKDETYEININKKKIIINASSYKGFFYGIVTLTQLSKINDGILNCCTIYDEPDMHIRAVSDDISRGQISTFENFKSIIRRLSEFKVNTYFPYIEDVFKFKCEPEIGKYSGPVKPLEWKKLCEYAKKFYISVRPIFNTLGHWEKIGCIDKFKDYMLPIPDKTINNFVNVLNPKNPLLRTTILNLLDEIVDAFGKGAIHVGGDEPAHLTETFGKEDAAKLYINHYNWLSNELKNRNCTMAMYTDVFSKVWGNYSIGIDRIKEIYPDTNFVFWKYEPDADYSDLNEMLKMNLNVYISPTTWSWCRLAPDIKKCWDNSRNLIKTADGRSKGIIMSGWCDDGADNLRELNWAGYAISGLYGWNNNTKLSFDDFMGIFHKQFYCFKDFDVKKIYNLYEYDEQFCADDSSAVRKEFFKDARKPVDGKMKTAAYKIIEQYKSIRQYLIDHRPKYNIDAYNALIFSTEREIFLIRKLMILTTGKFNTREEAMSYIKPIEKLTLEIKKIRKEHKILWFDCNRKSEWGYVESKYIDLEESFKSLSRYCKNCIRFSDYKYMI